MIPAPHRLVRGAMPRVGPTNRKRMGMARTQTTEIEA
jgi:hypothetical protein